MTHEENFQGMVRSPYVISWQAVGSRVTCNPAPTNTDIDVLCLVSSLSGFEMAAVIHGWALRGSLAAKENTQLGSSNKFASLTLGQYNVIGTDSPVFYNRFIAATSVAKRLNLLNKQDRIALFQAVLYGVALNDTRNREI